MPLDDMTCRELQRYIDGQLAGSARAAFEHRVRHDSGLRAELAHQVQLNKALKRMFPGSSLTAVQIIAAASKPMTPHAPARGAGSGVGKVAPPVTTAPARHGMSFTLRRLAVAAALAGGLVGTWMIWREVIPHSDQSLPPGTQQVTVFSGIDYYHQTVDHGFEPDWVCKDDTEFSNTFKDRLGQAMALKPMPAGEKMLGLGYTHVLTPHTMSMLAEADGQKIIVLIDKIEADNSALVNGVTVCGDLRTFRKQVGSLVMYEITPLEQPKVMDFLVQPPA